MHKFLLQHLAIALVIPQSFDVFYINNTKAYLSTPYTYPYLFFSLFFCLFPLLLYIWWVNHMVIVCGEERNLWRVIYVPIICSSWTAHTGYCVLSRWCFGGHTDLHVGLTVFHLSLLLLFHILLPTSTHNLFLPYFSVHHLSAIINRINVSIHVPNI